MSNNGNSVYGAFLQKQELPYLTTECQVRWVSETLKNKISEWVPDVKDYIPVTYDFVPPSPEPVFINAPTGMGKTTFIFEDLAEFARVRGQWVLILSNRLALNMQFKQNLNERCGGLGVGTAMLEDVNTFGCITLCTYQSVLSWLNSYSGPDPLFIVCDEAHFFCSDAVFNPWTEEILLSIMFRFKTSCRIYMSATPWDVKPVIAAAEYLFLQAKSNRGSFDAAKYQRRAIKEYCFKNSFENISLSFFMSWDTITDRIKMAKDDSKWLIFVSSKENGKELKDCLTNDVADYIDSSFRNEDDAVMKNLTRRQRFDKRVLICTSVLDNGISFQDDALKQVVVDSVDSVEMIQAVGRKRVKSGENVHVYVRLPNSATINTYLTTNEYLYRCIQTFEKNPEAFIYGRWGHLSESEQKLFGWCFQTDIVVRDGKNVQIRYPVFRSNSLAKYQLGRKSHELEKLKDEISIDSDAFAKRVCNLFGKEYLPDMCDDGKNLKEVAKGLTVILEQYVGKDIDVEVGMQELDAQLQGYINENPVRSLNFTFKRDGNRSAEHVRKIITKFNLPFILSKKGERKSNCYFISRKEKQD